MLYKGFEPEEGDDVQFVGVHALAWRAEWGRPKIAFVEVEDEIQAKYTDLLRRLRKAVGEMEREKTMLKDCVADGVDYAIVTLYERIPELEDK